MDASIIFGVINVVAVVASLLLLVRSNGRLAASMRMNTLQQVTNEMNALRTERADRPDLERSLFEGRREWTDLEIQRNLMAVKMANIFEWAYLARRDGLIDADVWTSWAVTWRSFILSSAPMKEAFRESVWTFCRDPKTSAALSDLVEGKSAIGDPHKAWKFGWHWRRRDANPT